MQFRIIYCFLSNGIFEKPKTLIMESNQCFVCADDCSKSYFYLINLTSKKYKTKYTSLISDLINSEYELRVTNENKICERCSVLLEKFDELQHETKTVKSVLSRQIANTYSIETSEEMVYMDKSKIFIEIRTNSGEVKYSCKLCPRYIIDGIDTVNTHIMYHKIATEGQIQTNEILKEVVTTQKRNNPIGREHVKKPEPVRNIFQHEVVQEKPTVKVEKKRPEVVQEVKHEKPLEITTINIQQNDYDEETLEMLLDFELLNDSFYDSNLRNHRCVVTGCTQEFTYVSDYVRHLRMKHKSTLNHVFAVVRANIKRPTKQSKFMCPFCFTKTGSSQSLEAHVRQHEEAAKSNLFTDRVNDFVASVMSASRCSTCDEFLDPYLLECNHEIAKNGLATQLRCIYCERCFYSDKLYNNHLATSHGHCFVCGSTCDDKVVLADHIRSHMKYA